MPEDTRLAIGQEVGGLMKEGKVRVLETDKLLERYQRQIDKQEQFKPEPENELDPTDD